ncbi:MAG: hypothetical protein AVDCRST_MAG68-1739, partial [uncultured Gemmatimonadetes bacterium]
DGVAGLAGGDARGHGRTGAALAVPRPGDAAHPGAGAAGGGGLDVGPAPAGTGARHRRVGAGAPHPSPGARRLRGRRLVGRAPLRVGRGGHGGQPRVPRQAGADRPRRAQRGALPPRVPLHPRVGPWGAGARAPAAASLVLWSLAATAGRL